MRTLSTCNIRVVDDLKRLRELSAKEIKDILFLNIQPDGSAPPGVYTVAVPDNFDAERHSLLGGPRVSLELVVAESTDDGIVLHTTNGPISVDTPHLHMDTPVYNWVSEPPCVDKGKMFITIGRHPETRTHILWCNFIYAGGIYVRIPRGRMTATGTLELTGERQIQNRNRMFIM